MERTMRGISPPATRVSTTSMKFNNVTLSLNTDSNLDVYPMICQITTRSYQTRSKCITSFAFGECDVPREHNMPSQTQSKRRKASPFVHLCWLMRDTLGQLSCTPYVKV